MKLFSPTKFHLKIEVKWSSRTTTVIFWFCMLPFYYLECLLENWYFQKIPNNPKFSNVERDVSEEWIVLVGMKPEMSEVCHKMMHFFFCLILF
jgi:hypothetical protein